MSKIKKKDSLDKFYTSHDVAVECMSLLKTQVIEECIYIEPSAGDGAFSNIIDCIAYDIAPDSDGIIEQDWLSVKSIPYDNWIMFGNPPFGSRNKLSKDFIKHGIALGCLYIGFVLPNVFNKYTMQSVFPDNWKLIKSKPLPKDSFILNGDTYHVPCTFYVWTRSDLHTINIRTVKGKEYTKDFSFCRKNEGDLFMFGAAPTKIIPKSCVTKNNRGYYLNTNISKEELSRRSNSIDWATCGNSSVNGGVAWFTKSEIIEIWEKYYGY